MKPDMVGGRACLLTLILLLLAPLLLGQRVVYSGKGASTDTPAPHPLSYWTRNAIARDDGGDLCIGCTWHGRKLRAEDYTAATQVTTIGQLGGHVVLQLIIAIHGDSATEGLGSEFHWKLLLEQVGPDAYLEFFHLQPTDFRLTPAAIVQVGDEPVLYSSDSDGGNGGGCWEGYWWFDSSGPQPVDFTPVYKAIAAVVPHNTAVPEGCWALHLAKQEIVTAAQETSAPCHACGWVGTVTARFRLHGATAEPLDVHFTPEVAN